jgi:hypothetical protein
MPLRYTILAENDDGIRADEKQIDSEKFDEVLIVRISYLVCDNSEKHEKCTLVKQMYGVSMTTFDQKFISDFGQSEIIIESSLETHYEYMFQKSDDCRCLHWLIKWGLGGTKYLVGVCHSVGRTCPVKSFQHLLFFKRTSVEETSLPC